MSSLRLDIRVTGQYHENIFLISQIKQYSQGTFPRIVSSSIDGQPNLRTMILTIKTCNYFTHYYYI